MLLLFMSWHVGMPRFACMYAVCMYRLGMFLSLYTREGAAVSVYIWTQKHVCVRVLSCVRETTTVGKLQHVCHRHVYVCAVLRHFTISNDTLSCGHVTTCNDNDMILFTSMDLDRYATAELLCMDNHVGVCQPVCVWHQCVHYGTVTVCVFV